ncbi:1,4-alpha-glucan branching protein GlgB [Mediannikoviicoccus vaginalis]|uniref:1,4-alpha-glucan branching protein GlgB n=1 Tax=Mediannikoviicoccus vaginalis TaxID=2899727 RepID=UPI001EFFF9C7|nr:1,4-alpha-glucan branching protein GlgB [Mediannikoviicoccus vaginalis]
MKFFYQDNLEKDAYLYNEGKNYKAYDFLGSHKINIDGKEYVRFVVWAPRAKFVNLCGDFNYWDELNLPLERIGQTGLWTITVEGINIYDSYKYRIVGPNDQVKLKSDPFAFHAENRPNTASKFYDLEGYKWNDKRWMNKRVNKNGIDSPISIYELNLGSWKKKDNGDFYSYREMADELVDYVKEMGFTHVELMPVMEHPYDGSWGYQISGYFAPTSRFGTPHDFMYMVDKFHQKNIGVILDWVPGHFCPDEFALREFDGTPTYESEHSSLSQNEHWGTVNFDLGRNEVKNFLISSALYWMDYYHIDGIRVDAVAYIIHYRIDHEVGNPNSNNVDWNGVNFLKELNETIRKFYPEVIMVAEDSSPWPNVTKSVSDGGLGFEFKWNMGWMNDTLKYVEMDPLFRKDHHDLITFSLVYAFNENFILPFSHDEVVHMKGSMINKMPGNYDDKFSALKLLMMFMFGHPGKKLNFMGNEIAQFDEWNEWGSLTWSVLDYDSHRKYQKFFKELNEVYRKEKALWEVDDSYDGFEWIEVNNRDESVFIFERIAKDGEKIICAFNFTGVKRENYPIGVNEEGSYKVIFNSAMEKYGGHLSRNKSIKTNKEDFQGRENSFRIDLEPLSAVFIKKK